MLSVSDNGRTFTFAPADITGTTVPGGPVRGTNVQVLSNIVVTDGNLSFTPTLVDGNIVASFPAAPTSPVTATETVNLTGYYGSLTPNWLREQNERVVLFGALAEVFAYLQEDDQAQKYAQIFFQEIQERQTCLLYTSPSPRD